MIPSRCPMNRARPNCFRLSRRRSVLGVAPPPGSTVVSGFWVGGRGAGTPRWLGWAIESLPLSSTLSLPLSSTLSLALAPECSVPAQLCCVQRTCTAFSPQPTQPQDLGSGQVSLFLCLLLPHLVKQHPPAERAPIKASNPKKVHFPESQDLNQLLVSMDLCSCRSRSRTVLLD